MKYLKSEHLKFRRTFFNKLLIIAPLITAVFAWLMAGFTGFQYMSLYWWYSFLLPGTITVLCYLSNQKEIRADKYYSVYSMSINLKKFWISKNLILIEKMIFAAFILALLVCVSNIISPFLFFSFPHTFISIKKHLGILSWMFWIRIGWILLFFHMR